MSASAIIKLLGFSFLLLAALVEIKFITISDTFIFSYSLSAFFFACSDLLKFKVIDEGKGKFSTVVNKLNYYLSYLRFPCNILAVISIVVLPQIFEKYKVDFTYANNIFTLLGVSIVILLIGFKDKKKEMLKEIEIRKLITEIVEGETNEKFINLQKEIEQRFKEIDVEF